jgi:hypothetical protein
VRKKAERRSGSTNCLDADDPAIARLSEAPSSEAPPIGSAVIGAVLAGDPMSDPREPCLPRQRCLRRTINAQECPGLVCQEHGAQHGPSAFLLPAAIGPVATQTPAAQAPFDGRRTCSTRRSCRGASRWTQRHVMTNRRDLVPGWESDHRVKPGHALQRHPRWFRVNSPKIGPRPALKVDSTPLSRMRKKNLRARIVFTRADISSSSYRLHRPVHASCFIEPGHVRSSFGPLR